MGCRQAQVQALAPSSASDASPMPADTSVPLFLRPQHCRDVLFNMQLQSRSNQVGWGVQMLVASSLQQRAAEVCTLKQQTTPQRQLEGTPSDVAAHLAEN